MKPKFDIEVKLSGEDGNAFYILAKVRKALIEAGATDEEVKQFLEDAKSSNYDHLLQTCFKWVEVV